MACDFFAPVHWTETKKVRSMGILKSNQIFGIQWIFFKQNVEKLWIQLDYLLYKQYRKLLKNEGRFSIICKQCLMNYTRIAPLHEVMGCG